MKILAGLGVLLFLAFTPAAATAQDITISGIVSGELDRPLAGATVSLRNAATATMTDADGKYTLQVPPGAVIVFSFSGYETVERKVGSDPRINVTMKVSDNTLEDVVVVGYGVQQKASLSGAVSDIKGSDIRKTENENPQNMLTGKIPGVRVWQKSAEPGTYRNNFDIRGLGAPLIIIDGIPGTTEQFQRMNANDIDNISVLKDASAAIYGVRAANGVVLITTKKGTKTGKTAITYNGSYTLQRPSGMPKLTDPEGTMTLYNERANTISNDGNFVPVYNQSQFDAYRNGTIAAVDWNGLVFAESSPQTQQDLSISGGNEKTQYFVGLGYLYQEGFLKSRDLNYDKYNLRTNLSSEIAGGLTLNLKLNVTADERNNPYTGTTTIIRSYWRQGVLHPAYADPDNTMLNYDGLELDENPVALINSDVSGYRKYKQKYLEASASLNYDFGTLLPALEGLSIKGLFGYDYRMDNNESFRREYYQYAFNEATNSYDRRLYNLSSPTQLRREMYDRQQNLTQVLLNYNRTFGKHAVNAVAGWEGQKQNGDNFYAQRDLPFTTPLLFIGNEQDKSGGSDKGGVYDYVYSSYIGRLSYNYDKRYLIEGQFRYDGSSKFTPHNRWGFFPSLSAGWRASEESFFKDIAALSFVDNLKLRGSYGVLGDDGFLDYDWATGYAYPATNSNAANGYYNQYAPGYIFDGKFVSAYSPLALPNLNSTWSQSKMLDIGVDFEAWGGLFGFTFDYFERKRTGLFARNTGELPTVVGSTAPRENLDSDKQFGIDLELTHRNRIGSVRYNVRAIGTITRQERLIGSEKGPWGNSYDRWRNDNLNNRYQGVQFGYEAAGRFENWDDIWYYPIFKERQTLPGDYKYLDWNGDGEINGLDEHPFAFDQTPWLNYSLILDVNYRNFDLNVLLQGTALGSMEYKEPLYAIWGSNGGGALTQYLDRWHPVDPTADIYDPKTEWVSGYYNYTGSAYARSNSAFNRVSTAYLRLKSIEVGYTFPRIAALPSSRFRIYANAYNMLTFTGVKFVDPEHPDDDLGRLYPLNKTYTVGLSLSF